MKRAKVLGVITLATTLLFLLFLSIVHDLAQARGGRGGGGRGGGGFSRGGGGFSSSMSGGFSRMGPAGGGGFSGSTVGGDRIAAGERPTHPIAGVPPGLGERPERPDRPDRPEPPYYPGYGYGYWRHQDHWDDWYGGGYWAWVPAETVVVTETVVAETVYPLGTIFIEESFDALNCGMNSVQVNGEFFRLCGANWFQMAYTDGQYAYVVVKPPAGY